MANQALGLYPEAVHDALKKRIGPIANRQTDRRARNATATHHLFLDLVVPWNYKTWDRKLAALEEET